MESQHGQFDESRNAHRTNTGAQHSQHRRANSSANLNAAAGVSAGSGSRDPLPHSSAGTHRGDETPRAHYKLYDGKHLLEANGGDLGERGSDPTFAEEVPNMVLLVVLYMMQGVPLGLTMGSMPFMLSNKASYTQIGVFSIAGYPYSFKLLWSPIVDSIYSARFGRRKSWIVPLQLCSALLMFLASTWADARLNEVDVQSVTLLFFFLVLLAATQDIAVDGWALTLLSRRHVGYASTCQTIGMNLGYFTSFTVFLALSDPDFCNSYFRPKGTSVTLDVGIVTLGSYMRFWAIVYVIVTLVVWFGKQERNREVVQRGGHEDADPEMSIMDAYSQLWGVVRLPAVLRLTVVLLTCRLAMLPAESAAPLKLLEKGVSKEALAGLVLLEFPCELLSAVVAGRWSAGASPFKPWLLGYLARLVAAAAVTAVVYVFPDGAAALQDHPSAFLALAAVGLTTSFTSTLMFTAMGSFYNRISDPAMGGAYLTLLNTIANMGIILPKIVVFYFIDELTYNECRSEAGEMLPDLSCPQNIQASRAPNECVDAGATCVNVQDGFYIGSYFMLAVGVLLLLHFRGSLPKLEALPPEAWRDKSLHRR